VFYSQASLVCLQPLPTGVLLLLLRPMARGVHLCSNVQSAAAGSYFQVMAVSHVSVLLSVEPMSCFPIHSTSSSSYPTAPLVEHRYPWACPMELRADSSAFFGVLAAGSLRCSSKNLTDTAGLFRDRGLCSSVYGLLPDDSFLNAGDVSSMTDTSSPSNALASALNFMGSKKSSSELSPTEMGR